MENTQRFFRLGHVNFGQLTTHVPHSGYGVFTERHEADAACAEARKQNPQIKGSSKQVFSQL